MHLILAKHPQNAVMGALRSSVTKMLQSNLVRLGGLLAIASGCAVAYFFIFTPYQESLRGETVSISLHALVFVPFSIPWGLFLLVCGDEVPYRNPETMTFTRAGWALMSVVAMLSLALFVWYTCVFQPVPTWRHERPCLHIGVGARGTLLSVAQLDHGPSHMIALANVHNP